MKEFLSPLLVLAFAVAASAAPVSVATDPQGYLKLSMAPGTGTSYTINTVSLPLLSPIKEIGTVTSLSANTLIDSEADWTPGAFSAAATPHLVRIVSGNASGRTFLISPTLPNTDSTLTVDTQGTDLTEIGLAIGDRYHIFSTHTLLSFFGAPASTGIKGGTNAASADQVQLYSASSGWLSYYYNTNQQKWLRVGPPIDSNNVVIRPDQGILYNRIAAGPLTLQVNGTVPTAINRTVINPTGATFIGSIWPTATTLASLNLNQLPEWASSAASTSADQVQIYTPANGWKTFYHNGSNWRRVGPPINSDSEPIEGGSAVLVIKTWPTQSPQVVTQTSPYTLQ